MELNIVTLDDAILTFNDSMEESFWKDYAKIRDVGSKHFLLFPQCFYPRKKVLSESHIKIVVYKCFQFGPG